MTKTSRTWLVFASYDFSNSGFVIMFQSFLFPLFFSGAGAGSGVEPDRVWPWIVALSSVLAIAVGPYVGRLADILGKSRVFAVCVLVAGLLSSLTPVAIPTTWLLLSLSFVVFNTFFELSQTLYDSFLLDAARGHDEMTKLSSFAWGFGYLGGALFAAAYFALDKGHVAPASMLALFGAMYLVLSLPAIRGFHRLEPARATTTREFDWRFILRTSRPVPWSHLAIYWIIADCVAAILYFAPLYFQRELGLGMKTVGGIILGAQLLAFPMTIAMGRLAVRIGRIRTIQICLLIWALTLLGLFFANSLRHVVLVAVLMSFVIGSTQAILRAHFATHVVPEKAGEGLGYYAIAQKSASILSPLIVGLTVWLTGSMRPSFLLLAGLVLLALVLAPRLRSTT